MQATAGTTAGGEAAARSKIEPRLIAPFVECIRMVFRRTAKVDVRVLRPYVKREDGGSGVAGKYAVFGIIGFSGGITGVVTVSLARDAAERVVEMLSGAPEAVGTPAFADAVGELANMVSGSAKSKLGYEARITVPSVVIGDQCTVKTPRGMPCVVIPCDGPFGEFAVEVCIKSSEGSGQR